MTQNKLAILGAILGVLGIVAYTSIYTVHETQQSLLLQFGEPIKIVQEPGLQFKLPWQNVVLLEKRILDLDAPAEEVIASDKKRIVVDSYARFRIEDPLRYFQTVNNEDVARSRLSNIINSNLRKALGTVELQFVLSGERGDLMRRISDDVNLEATKLGIRIIDVRIKRADLPEANSQAVFRRMQAERERDAREARARGAEQAQKIRAEADRQRTVLLAEARKQSEILRGEGDGRRNRIFADAFSRDPEFFSFYRTMQAYGRSLNADDTSLVLSPDSDFFRYFNNIGGSDSP